MAELVTGAEMHAVEQAGIAAGRVTGLGMMERAGEGVVEAVFETWPELDVGGDRRAVVLCGPGNNGGDGFVVARLLARRGWQVDVFLMGNPERLPPDARTNHDRWAAMGQVRPMADADLDRRPLPDLAVDAVFGTGLTRPFDSFDDLRRTINTWQSMSANGGAPHVVSVDIPSGLCADSGRYLTLVRGDNTQDSAIAANLTVTFHRAKPGHYLASGPQACGRLSVKEIGL